ncbi:MAG: hypothetical protein DRP72_02250, partial [Candidatus Omnitrophota bacterium]
TVWVFFATYNERERILPREENNPYGEDTLRVKIDQLENLFKYYKSVLWLDSIAPSHTYLEMRVSAVEEWIEQAERLFINIQRSERKDGGENSIKGRILIFGGGSGTLFYINSFKNFEVIRSITPFDGDIFYDEQGMLLSKIEDNPSSSGRLRQVIDGLPALGDISKVVVEHLNKSYVKYFMLTRFSKNALYFPDNKKKEDLNLDSFEQVIEEIHKYYTSLDTSNQADWRFPSYSDFLNMLRKYAQIIDECEDKEEWLFDTTRNNKKFRHSVKNILLFALILERLKEKRRTHLESEDFDWAINKFVKLLKLDEMVLDKIMLTVNYIPGLVLVAKLANGKYLVGQEEITQNLSGEEFNEIQKIEDVFFAEREKVREYLTNNKGRRNINSREGEINPVNSQIIRGNLKINPRLEKLIEEMEEENKSGFYKNMIVFGPGSQFTSVILHLLIPGVITKLAQLESLPRILVLNPLEDVETGGITDEEYFNHVINLIEKIIKEELGDENANLSYIFDFVVVNDKKLNREEVKKQAEKEKEIKTRGKRRLGLIEFNIPKIIERLYNCKKHITLVRGDLMEIVNSSMEGLRLSYNPKIIEELFMNIQEFYNQNKGVSGISLVSDTHATVDGALVGKLLHFYDPLFGVGDLSDRGHNLFPLLRIVDNFTTADHELWLIGAILGIEPMVALYLRMAFNYENDDLIRDLGLGEIIEKAKKVKILNKWEKVGYIKNKDEIKALGKLFNYLFAKLYYEFFYQVFTREERVNEREELLKELARVILWGLGKGIFEFSVKEFKNKVLEEIKQIIKQEKKEKIKEVENSSKERIINYIKQHLIENDALHLLTEEERRLINEVKEIIFNQFKDKNSLLFKLIIHFLKAPLYRVIYPEPQIPRTERMRKLQILDPKNRKIAILATHALPPMNKEGYFADLMGKSIPKGKLKEYYDKLNEELIRIKEILIENEFSSLEDLREKIIGQKNRFFAGFDTSGAELCIPFDEWWIRFTDSEFSPVFARIHKRITNEYITKEDEPDNIVYKLFYKDNIDNFILPEEKKDNIAKMYSLNDEDFVKERDHYKFNREKVKEIKEKVLKYIVDSFIPSESYLKPDRKILVVGHKKIVDNQIRCLAKTEKEMLFVIDPTFAEKGGKTGALDATQNAAELWIGENGFEVIKRIRLSQVFLEKEEFVKEIKKDKDKEDPNFKELTSQNLENFDELMNLQIELLKRLTFVDIIYYDIKKISLQRLFDISGENWRYQKNSYRFTLLGELAEILHTIGGDKIEEKNKIIDVLKKEKFVDEKAKAEQIYLNKELICKLMERIDYNSSLNIFANEEELNKIREGKEGQTKYKPHRFIQPVIIASQNYNENTYTYKIKRTDREDLLVIEDSDEILDKLDMPSLKERLQIEITRKNADYSLGNITDEVE